MPGHDREWEQVWDEFDQASDAVRTAPPPPCVAAAAPRPAQRRQVRLGFLVAATALALLPVTTESFPRDPLPALVAADSLSPIEALLPPLETAISRLADESAVAACYVLTLRPGAVGCLP